MPTRTSRKPASGSQADPGNIKLAVEPDETPFAPGTTGRYLVLMKAGAERSGLRTLDNVSGLKLASSSDFPDASACSVMSTAGTGSKGSGIYFDKLGVAVVDADPDQFQALSVATAASDNDVMATEPERVVWAIGAFDSPFSLDPGTAAANSGPALPTEYLRGYRDAVNHLIGQLLGDSGTESAGGRRLLDAMSEAALTWGLQATKAGVSKYSGKDIRVAILDTGLDLAHPDFTGRAVTSKSFIPGQTVQDGHGHGTHTAGTACGPKQPGTLPRYGVAYDAEIFIGKVLNNDGRGADGSILQGIDWAINHKCAIASMSLGSPVQVGQSYSRIFETAAKRALAAGTLIIAAAGNDSHRPGSFNPVSHPANCPSITAVAAVDAQLKVASFSNAGVNTEGGQVDIAGPGVGVRSSWPRPTLYNTISGTSMATPHVAGIAALWAELHPEARGLALQSLLTQHAQRLSLLARDIGAGLVQAP